MRARWLDAVKGRWDNRDPIGYDSNELNIYGFSVNNPETNLDASGLQSVPVGSPPNYSAAFAWCADCSTCVQAIHSRWSVLPSGDKTWFHNCNHLFTHCISCCTLTRSVNASCAIEAQKQQDFWSVRDGKRGHSYSASYECRMGTCKIGVQIGQNKQSCFDGCKRAFPFDGGPDCTSKLGSKVLCAREKPPHKDMLLRHLPSLGDACMAVDNPHRYDAYPQGHSLFSQ